jgi:hypothetical protein
MGARLRRSGVLDSAGEFPLHTDTKDHPAALPNYLKAGFESYKEGVKDRG